MEEVGEGGLVFLDFKMELLGRWSELHRVLLLWLTWIQSLLNMVNQSVPHWSRQIPSFCLGSGIGRGIDSSHWLLIWSNTWNLKTASFYRLVSKRIWIRYHQHSVGVQLWMRDESIVEVLLVDLWKKCRLGKCLAAYGLGRLTSRRKIIYCFAEELTIFFLWWFYLSFI